jgi:hypothetical protein
VNSAKLWEPEPNGMRYIQAGSFVFNRTDGSRTKDFEVTIEPFWMNQAEVSVKQHFECEKNLLVVTPGSYQQNHLCIYLLCK